MNVKKAQFVAAIACGLFSGYGCTFVMAQARPAAGTGHVAFQRQAANFTIENKAISAQWKVLN